MSPSVQDNARIQLEQELQNSMTGDPGVDSLIAQQIKRNYLFGIPNRMGAPAQPDSLAGPAPQPPNPFMQLLMHIFGQRK
jgi:hypothetical protein